MKTLISLIVFVIVLAAGTVDAQIRQWTDDRGVVHFVNDPRPPTYLESIAILPGDHRVTIDALLAVDIVRRIEYRSWFGLPVSAVAVGPTFYALTGADQSEALWTIVHFYARQNPLKPAISSFLVYDASSDILLGSYDARRGFMPAAMQAGALLR